MVQLLILAFLASIAANVPGVIVHRSYASVGQAATANPGLKNGDNVGEIVP